MSNQTAVTVLDESEEGANEELQAADKAEDFPQQIEEEQDTPEAYPESKRKRIMTQRAKEAKEQELTKAFWKAQRSFITHTGTAENVLKGYCTPLVFDDTMTFMTPSYKELVDIYDEIKNVCQTPDPALRIAVDRATADKATIVGKFQERLEEFGDTRSQRSHRSSRLTYRSGGSASTATKLVEAAANAAAHQAQLESEKIESQKEEELQAALKRKAEADAESQAELDRIRRDIEQQKTRTLLAMEEARKKVYIEELSREQGGATGGLLSRAAPAKYIESPLVPATVSTSPSIATYSPIVHAPPATDFTALAQAISSAVSLNRLPPPEPSVFNGDLLTYNDWSIAFKILIQDKGIPKAEQIHYLKRYLSGPAREAVSGYFLLNSDTAFEKAKAVLDKRYGDPFLTAEAFRDKLDSWPKIPARDGAALRRFADFLHQCKTAMESNDGLGILNDTRENRKLLFKLPSHIVDRWSRIVAKAKSSEERYPMFDAFARFISEEAEIACDPVTNINSLKIQDHPMAKVIATTAPRERNRNIATTLSTGTNIPDSCLFCHGRNHSTTQCFSLCGKLPEEKEEFVKTNGLCYACLTKGHFSKGCPKRAKCSVCNKSHPTSMHIEDISSITEHTEDDSQSTDQELPMGHFEDTMEIGTGSCGSVMKNNGKHQMSSMIVPVWVSTEEDPESEHLVYAMLDSMSDTTFILNDTYSKLNTTFKESTLQLSTMSSKGETTRCKKVSNLVVRGYNSNTRVSLPPAYSRGFIPVDRSHIPTPESVRDWPHLNQVSEHLLPLQDCEVGLLIGYNCSQALAPLDTVMGGSRDPFGIRTDLGWSVVGQLNTREENYDKISITHRVHSTETSLELQPCSEKADTIQRTKQHVVEKQAKKLLSPLQVSKDKKKDIKKIKITEQDKVSSCNTRRTNGIASKESMIGPAKPFTKSQGPAIVSGRISRTGVLFKQINPVILVVFLLVIGLLTHQIIPIESTMALNEMDKNMPARLNRDRFDWVSPMVNAPYVSHMGDMRIRTVRNALGIVQCGIGRQLKEDSLQIFIVKSESIAISKPITTAYLTSLDNQNHCDISCLPPKGRYV